MNKYIDSSVHNRKLTERMELTFQEKIDRLEKRVKELEQTARKDCQNCSMEGTDQFIESAKERVRELEEKYFSLQARKNELEQAIVNYLQSQDAYWDKFNSLSNPLREQSAKLRKVLEGK